MQEVVQLYGGILSQVCVLEYLAKHTLKCTHLQPSVEDTHTYKTAKVRLFNKCIQRSSVMHNTLYYEDGQFRHIFRAIIGPVFQNP
jgi:hypothetical protein